MVNPNFRKSESPNNFRRSFIPRLSASINKSDQSSEKIIEVMVEYVKEKKEI